MNVTERVGEGGRASTGRNHSEPFKPTDERRTRSIALSRAPLAVRPIVMDFRHENMLISVRTEGAERLPGNECQMETSSFNSSLFLPSFLFPSIAVSEMPKDHFFCFADCANAERERRTRSTRAKPTPPSPLLWKTERAKKLSCGKI